MNTNVHQVSPVPSEGAKTALPASLDLQRFCWSNDIRKHLRQPWAHKGHIYATNGHICVRVPAPDQAEAVFPHKNSEAIESIFGKIGERTYAPLPAFDLGPKCTFCDGKGTLKQSKCPDCDGDGEFQHGTHDYECIECCGDGFVDDQKGEERECQACDGFGTLSKYIGFPGGVGYQARYLNWIKDLPGLMFSIGEAGTDSTTPPAHFAFDGGEGVLMPMREYA